MQPTAACGQQSFGGLPQDFASTFRVDGFAEIEQAGEDAGDIGVDDGSGSIESKAGYGAGGVASHTGQRGDGGEVVRQFSAVLCGDLLGGAVQVAGACVVAEALPDVQHVGFAGCGKGRKIRKPFRSQRS